MGLNVHFSGGIPGWLAAGIVAAATGLTVLFYLRARASAPRGHLAFLTALRLAAVLIVSLLALRPLVTAAVEKGRQGRRIILVDTSASMSVADFPNLPNRLESVKAALCSSSPAIASLGARFKLEMSPFDESMRAQTALAEVATLQAAGRASSIAVALNAAAARLAGEPEAGIILFSDGVETGSPAYSGGVPVTAVGVGSRLSAEGAFRDLILSGVEVLPAGEPVISKDHVARIAAYVEGLGMAGLVTPVVLKDASGAVLAQENVVIDAERGEQRVVLSFTPARTGNFKYTVEIPVRPDETVKENNLRNLNVTVTDPELRVLYVEGTLRWEYRYLKRMLERDPNVRLLALVRVSERMYNQQGNVTDVELSGFPGDLETLKSFNVIIIGDLPASAFSRQDMANVRESVRSGAGLLMLGGYSSFAGGGYAETPLADVLPVVLDAGAYGQEKNEFPLRLTDAGEASPIFAGITGHFSGPSRAASGELPRLLGHTLLGRAKPGAQVLAENPLRGDAGNAGMLPILVTHEFAGGRAAAFAADTTWQWFTVPRGVGTDSPYVRFWAQMVRWLARREARDEAGEPGVTAWVDKAFYAPGDEVTVTARVRGADGLLADGAEVEAVIEGAQGTRVPMAGIAGDKGTYACRITPGTAGSVRVTVSASQGALALGQASAAFEVGVDDIEMRRLDIDEDYLRAIASDSGGEYMPLLEFASYAARLQRAVEKQKTVEILNLRQRRVLYPLFLVFIAMVTLEWVWRKRLEMP